MPGVGKPFLGLPIKFGDIRPAIRSAAPRIGRHNREILDGSLGSRAASRRSA